MDTGGGADSREHEGQHDALRQRVDRCGHGDEAGDQHDAGIGGDGLAAQRLRAATGLTRGTGAEVFPHPGPEATHDWNSLTDARLIVGQALLLATPLLTGSFHSNA